MTESIRDVLRDIRSLLRNTQRTTSINVNCCVTLPSGNPVPVAPPYGYDLPSRTPQQIGGDYCRKVQAAIEKVVASWEEIMAAKPHWKEVGVSAIVYAIATSANIPAVIKNRLVWDVVANIYNTLLPYVEDQLVLNPFSLCDAARDYINSGDNSVPQTVMNAVPLLVKPAFALWWRLTGGITPLLDDPNFQYDANLYNASCCYLDLAVVKWEPKYVGPNCQGYTDNFHGVDWYGTSIQDQNGNDVSYLYPRVLYAFNNLVAFRRSDYIGMYFCNPGYPGQLANRYYLTDTLDITVCRIFQEAYLGEVMQQLTAYQVQPFGSQYLLFRAALVGEGRDWYITRDIPPGGFTPSTI